MEPRKRTYLKFILGFLGIIFLTFVGLILLRAYTLKQAEKKVDELAQALKKADQESYQTALVDTYGGKTPQETLKLYIEAVEKGDYVLASKYFIGANQGKELESFKNNAQNTTQDKIQKYLTVLKQILKNSGEYSDDKIYFSFDGPVLIRMKLYPNGIWKIIEI